MNVNQTSPIRTSVCPYLPICLTRLSFSMCKRKLSILSVRQVLKCRAESDADKFQNYRLHREALRKSENGWSPVMSCTWKELSAVYGICRNYLVMTCAVYSSFWSLQIAISIYLSIYVYLSIYLSVSINLSVCLSIYLCLSIYISVRLSVSFMRFLDDT